ncbi:unnamed protein product, partial [Prorocentrum cordatum]
MAILRPPMRDVKDGAVTALTKTSVRVGIREKSGGLDVGRFLAPGSLYSLVNTQTYFCCVRVGPTRPTSALTGHIDESPRRAVSGHAACAPACCNAAVRYLPAEPDLRGE